MSTTVAVRLNVNGQAHELEVEPRLLLVHALRDNLGLTGTHVGCDTSNCGACTVHLDGKAVKSCTVLTVQADQVPITTIEGLPATVGQERRGEHADDGWRGGARQPGGEGIERRGDIQLEGNGETQGWAGTAVGDIHLPEGGSAEDPAAAT